ncbi:hypothetical protein ACW9H6_25790 [Pseudomonas sp. SDO528_S397]
MKHVKEPSFSPKVGKHLADGLFLETPTTAGAMAVNLAFMER